MIEPARVPAVLPDGKLAWFPNTQSLPVVWLQGLDVHNPDAEREPYVHLDRHSYLGKWGPRLLRLDMIAEHAPANMSAYLLALLREAAPDLVQERDDVDYPRGKPFYVEGKWWY